MMCSYKTVMLIAPSFGEDGHPALDAIPEIDALQALGFKVTTLQGPVSQDRLFSMAQRVQCDILHIVTGQTGDSTLLLSDAETLDVHGLLQIVRMTGARCVFLNACQSNYLAQVLVDRGIPVVISTTRAVNDSRAKRTAQAFYTMLTKTNDLHAAFVAAKGDDGLYAWTSNGGYTELLLKPIISKIDVLQDSIDEVKETNEKTHIELGHAIARIMTTFTPATTIKRYFLQVTVASWLIMIVIFYLFVTIDKVTP